MFAEQWACTPPHCCCHLKVGAQVHGKVAFMGACVCSLSTSHQELPGGRACAHLILHPTPVQAWHTVGT